MDAGAATGAEAGLTLEELALATRNHGFPLEALRHDRTPTGLHYLLIHYDIPDLDAAEHRLELSEGFVRPRAFSLDDLRALPAVTRPVTLECAGNGRARLRPRPLSQPWLLEAVGTADWTGVPLAALLEEAGLADDAVELVFTGADEGVEGGAQQHYARSLGVADARAADALVVYAMNGAPLPPQHGHPLRLVVPGWYGMASVKWLKEIRAVAQPFTGYQNAVAYRWRESPDDEGLPLTRIAVRALMAPPGIPDFYTRRRFVEPGACRLHGRAWSGHGAVTRVQVSADGGGQWWDADLEPPGPVGAWQAWASTWEAEPGTHELCVRATDDTGAAQPLQPVWNAGGYAVNAVQRVPVEVAAARGR